MNKFFIFVTLLLVLPFVKASIYFEEDFETCSMANLYQQNGWNGTDNSAIAVVNGKWAEVSVTTTSFFETKSLNGSISNYVEIIYDIKFNGLDTTAHSLTSIRSSASENMIAIQCDANNDLLLYPSPTSLVKTDGCLNTSWNTVEVDCTGNSTNMATCDVYYAGSLVVNDKDMTTSGQPTLWSKFNLVTLRSSTGQNTSVWDVDNICVADDVDTECGGAPPSDTCSSFASTGTLNCNDNCTFASNVSITNNVTITGNGTLTWNGGIWWIFDSTTNWIKTLLSDNCVWKGNTTDGGIKVTY